MQENMIINGSIYAVGGAICSKGECGYIAKYGLNGEVKWVKEYSQIDINSSQVMHYREDRIYITGRAKDSIATKTLVLDTLGNVEEDWNYSVEGAVTNFSKEVYYDEDYYYFITSEDLGNDLRGVLYKCDYLGNLIERLVFPKLEFTIPLSVRPYRGNLLISINQRNNASCPFGQNENDFGATYLAEVDKESMKILRDKKDVCYRFIANDIYISPTSEIIRTVILTDSMPSNGEGNLAIIFYDDNWETKNIIEYPHELAKGISNMKYTKDGNFYYSTIGENVEQTDSSSWPFGDLLIQKWTANHDLLWEKRYYSHLNKKRLKVKNFSIDESGTLHIVGYVWPDFPYTNTFDFWLFSVDSDGCHNSDCRDEINLDDLVNTQTYISANEHIVAYPNPLKNTLYFKHLDDKIPIMIMDAYGRLVKQIKYNIETGIDIMDIPAGVYFIKPKGFQTQRIIKF
jgi:hypothetical protein